MRFHLVCLVDVAGREAELGRRGGFSADPAEGRADQCDAVHKLHAHSERSDSLSQVPQPWHGHHPH